MKKLGIIGFGNMGGGIIKSLIAAGLCRIFRQDERCKCHVSVCLLFNFDFFGGPQNGYPSFACR